MPQHRLHPQPIQPHEALHFDFNDYVCLTLMTSCMSCAAIESHSNISFAMSAPEDTKQPLTATAASTVEEVTQEKNKPFEADQLALCVARLDALVHATCDKIPTAATAEGQLKTLREIRDLLAKQGTKTQFVWTVFLQVFGLIFALLFGIFAALSYNIGKLANVESSDANQLAFLSLCLSSNSVSSTYTLYFHELY